MKRPLNVLLLLSVHQKPDPKEEIDAALNIANESEERLAPVAVTRRVNFDLEPGKSIIAFYRDKQTIDDEDDSNELLAMGVYQKFHFPSSSEAKDIRKKYGQHINSLPETFVGYVEISDFKRVEDYALLAGFTEDGDTIDKEYLKRFGETEKEKEFGLEKASIYFFRDTLFLNVREEDKVRLLKAKKDELIEKCQDFVARWRRQLRLIERAKQSAKTKEEEEKFKAIGAEIPQEATAGNRSKKAKTRQIYLTRRAFPRVVFCMSCEEKIVGNFLHEDGLWKFLQSANSGNPDKDVFTSAERWEGTTYWWEGRIRGGGQRRVFWRNRKSAKENRVMVIVANSHDNNYADENRFMRANDKP